NAVISGGVGLTALACLVWVAIRHQSTTPLPSEAPAPSHNEPEITFEIRQNPAERQPRDRRDAIRVCLDSNRLRAHNVSREDVMAMLKYQHEIAKSPMRVDQATGIVFVTRAFEPKKYEFAFLKATAEGEIVRLKDVAMTLHLSGPASRFLKTVRSL